MVVTSVFHAVELHVVADAVLPVALAVVDRLARLVVVRPIGSRAHSTAMAASVTAGR